MLPLWVDNERETTEKGAEFLNGHGWISLTGKDLDYQTKEPEVDQFEHSLNNTVL